MTRKFREPVVQIERSGLENGPTRKMLFAQNPPVLLAKDKIDGSYHSVAEYLDIHYELLLEDFMYPLRDALKEFKKCPHAESFNGARVYRNVGIRRKPLSENRRPRNASRPTYVLAGLTSLDNTEQRNEENKIPSFGRLLLFTRTDFDKNLFLGKVVSDWTKTGEVELEIQQYCDTESKLIRGTYTMMQANAFYYKYEHILRAINSFSEDNFPMKEYIVYGSKQIACPAYLDRSTVYNVFGHKVAVLQDRWPLHEFTEMDKSQCSALKTALTRKIAVIQGPPGTGKTYFGVRLVKVLLDNIHVWNPRGRTPLLVVCQSNQALDHFLEGVLQYTKNVVRVGDQSQSEQLKPFFLNELVSRKLQTYPRGHPRGFVRQQVLHEANIVGMTTTGASARRDDLDQMRSPIVIVEEAAEVLEADVIVSMTEHCQHLILLGDHKQLKPIVTTHHLGTEYNLNISLFERLVRDQIVEVSRLTTQYRMRPEISSLLKPHIYEHLEDAPSTLNRPLVKGILKSVFFLHHDKTEETVKGKTGYFNTHEVEMLIRLAKYLVSVGYSPSQITIIAMYAEQRDKLMKEQKKHPEVKNLEIASVDSFQGKENEIILLSLVRNNKAGHIGFLGEETRICVALSRAKKGLFIMGNKKCLANRQRRSRTRISTVWCDVLQRLKQQNAVESKLSLLCEKHNVSLEVSETEHWNDDFCRPCYEDRLLKEKQKAAERLQLLRKQLETERLRLLREQESRMEADRRLHDNSYDEYTRASHTRAHVYPTPSYPVRAYGPSLPKESWSSWPLKIALGCLLVYLAKKIW